VGIWVWVLGKIPKKSGYLGMGIGYHVGIIPNTQYPQKKWVLMYG